MQPVITTTSSSTTRAPVADAAIIKGIVCIVGACVFEVGEGIGDRQVVFVEDVTLITFVASFIGDWSEVVGDRYTLTCAVVDVSTVAATSVMLD